MVANAEPEDEEPEEDAPELDVDRRGRPDHRDVDAADRPLPLWVGPGNAGRPHAVVGPE